MKLIDKPFIFVREVIPASRIDDAADFKTKVVDYTRERMRIHIQREVHKQTSIRIQDSSVMFWTEAEEYGNTGYVTFTAFWCPSPERGVEIVGTTGQLRGEYFPEYPEDFLMPDGRPYDTILYRRMPDLLRHHLAGIHAARASLHLAGINAQTERWVYRLVD